jgi:rRNA-processing protein FCF1
VSSSPAPAPWLARLLFAAGSLLAAAAWLPWLQLRYRPVFALLVVLFGLLLEQVLRRTRPERVAGSLAGLFVGCGAGAALLVLVPAVGQARSLGPFAVLLLGFLGAVSGGRVGDAVARSEAPPRSGRGRPRILDSSAAIDGRIAAIAEAGFLEGPLVVPGFVVRELQKVADSVDPDVRARGRRGLDVLERLRHTAGVAFEISEFGVGDDVTPVDERLVLAAESRGAALVTTDFNLNKVAGLRGVTVLNVNDLSRALRPPLAPGDRFEIRLVREGTEPGQGVGHLDDGAMVVVEDGRDRIGSTVEVELVRTLQTATGKLYFARRRDDPRGPDQNG